MASRPEVSDDEGFKLATIPLFGPGDVVRICQRARRAGEEFGLDRAEIQRWSTALFEVGRLLIGSLPATQANLTLGDGPSLQVHFHIPDLERFGGMGALDRAIAALRPIVRHVGLVPEDSGADLSLAVPFKNALPGKGTAQTIKALSRSPGVGWDSAAATPLGLSSKLLDDATPEGPKGEDAAVLDSAYRELHDAHRGLMTLFGHFDDHVDRLRLAEERLRLLLDSVPDYAICLLSADGAVTSWNAGGERVFGYPADEIIGRSFALFYAPQDREAGVPAAHLAAAAADGRLELEAAYLPRGGTAFAGHCVLTPMREEGRSVRAFSLVVRDITERKRLEDDLRRRAEDLAVANRAKEDFLATLSHELRTPLNAMLGWTRLLRMGKLDTPGVSRALETIERNAHLQEQLISDILDVSRIVTGKLRLELRPTDLSPLVDAAIDTLHASADAKGVRLESHVSFVGSVLGDPDRLEQVIWNLVVNAIKFTPPGGVIQVTLDRQGTSAVVTVADTGEGIASDLLPYVFDRFRQGDASVTRPHGGLGLGLSIVRHIVEMHGGKAVAHSEGRGRGATFSVLLPVRAVRHGGEIEPSRAQALTGLRVLVVDDEADAREVIARALKECGASTAAAASVGEALTMIPEFKPDVIVSDIRMPGEDGYALIRRIRALDSALGSLPMVALTGLAQAEDRRQALSAGFQSVVAKPVEVEELADVVREVSGRR